MKKQMMAFALMTSMAATTFISDIDFISAQDVKKDLGENLPIKQIKAEEMKKEGLNLVENVKILEITKEKDFYSLRVKTQKEELIFQVAESVFLFDKASNLPIQLKDLKKGDALAVVFPKNAMMTASIPARISEITAIVVKDNDEDLMISMIDEDLKEIDKKFIIMKNEKMNVFHVKNPDKSLTQESLKGAEAMILYKMATFSLPPQVNVDAAIVLNTLAELKHDEMLKEEEGPISNPKYIPLRKHAEEKGYAIKWQGVDKPIILEKNDIVVEISLNTKEFKYSHMTRDLQPLDTIKELDLMPMLENSTTMVSENFIRMLK